MKIILIILWLIVSVSMWVFATRTVIETEKFKYLEFRVRSIFYWIAVVASFLFGTFISK